MIFRLVCIILLLMLASVSYCQEPTDKASPQKIPSEYFEVISKKANSLEQKLEKQSGKILTRLKKQEARLRKKLSKIDSLSADKIFAAANEKYEGFEEKLKDTDKYTHYIPYLDTLKTSLKFLNENPELLNQSKEKLNLALDKVKDLESSLQKAENINQFIKERQQYLKQQLEQFGLAKELKQLNKEVFYYSQQIREYKEILKDPKKIERKAIDLLSKTKFFQDFMKKNSMLASLFRMPADDPNDPAYIASLAGLQTRAQVNALIQNQIAAAGPNAQQQISQNIQNAQAQLQQLKDKVNQWGGGSSDDIMPDGFKPNSQKTKSFFQRLELGTNIQTQKGSSFFPVTSDLGLSLGYKLSENGIVGIGASYKMGWGSGWNNLRITHQGAGLRSFIDWKLKGSFWITGGYEQNYKSELRDLTIPSPFGGSRVGAAWQTSGLIGISKVVSVKSKIFKKTKVQLLWDFLSYEQVPKAQPILFRVGYNF